MPRYYLLDHPFGPLTHGFWSYPRNSSRSAVIFPGQVGVVVADAVNAEDA
jgi:hypothetical protein